MNAGLPSWTRLRGNARAGGSQRDPDGAGPERRPVFQGGTRAGEATGNSRICPDLRPVTLDQVLEDPGSDPRPQIRKVPGSSLLLSFEKRETSFPGNIIPVIGSQTSHINTEVLTLTCGISTFRFFFLISGNQNQEPNSSRPEWSEHRACTGVGDGAEPHRKSAGMDPAPTSRSAPTSRPFIPVSPGLWEFQLSKHATGNSVRGAVTAADTFGPAAGNQGGKRPQMDQRGQNRDRAVTSRRGPAAASGGHHAGLHHEDVWRIRTRRIRTSKWWF